VGTGLLRDWMPGPRVSHNQQYQTVKSLDQVQQLKCCIKKNFLAPNLWPPSSPDLSPVDYEIWTFIWCFKQQYTTSVLLRSSVACRSETLYWCSSRTWRVRWVDFTALSTRDWSSWLCCVMLHSRTSRPNVLRLNTTGCPKSRYTFSHSCL